ncbi:contractile injection system tape measure protein [Flavobacterium sp. UBA4197]|uniref:contractile injection system tape measure protein n=1 Tax=Flavobacterium sp. UBA4197 TaxID=1946546 RepID=UPI00257C126F|nr:contractile injection system tape measure protein [Flavobacterium sp. UBA4197]
MKEAIKVENAGMVILTNYIPVLLERLRLVSGKQFTSSENQHNAALYLQYLITGLQKTDEVCLSLNKVLCGLPVNQDLADQMEISNEDQLLMTGLIEAAISHWTAIGRCSVDAFRGNWLIRDGILTEHEDKWELTVEKRVYDLLLNKSPFSFSIIKHPWMSKPLYVNWPY